MSGRVTAVTDPSSRLKNASTVNEASSAPEGVRRNWASEGAPLLKISKENIEIEPQEAWVESNGRARELTSLFQIPNSSDAAPWPPPRSPTRFDRVIGFMPCL